MLLFATATANEMKAAFGPEAPAVEQGGAVEYELNGRKLLLAVTGVGLVNAAFAAGRLLERDDIEGVVNLGIAGSYDTEAFALRATAYAWRETWPEYGLLGDDGRVDPKGIGFPQGEVGGKPVWNRVKLTPAKDAKLMNLHLDEGWQRASSISVNSVTGESSRAGWLKTSQSGDIENMEGFSLAFAALQRGLPFLEVRTISNLVGSRYEEEWDLKGALKGLRKVVETFFSK